MPHTSKRPLLDLLPPHCELLKRLRQVQTILETIADRNADSFSSAQAPGLETPSNVATASQTAPMWPTAPSERQTGTDAVTQQPATRESAASQTTSRQSTADETTSREPITCDAESTDSPPSLEELFHDLRVACRRAETVLQVVQPDISADTARWFRRRLRTIRRSFNPLRDSQVLLKWVRQQPDSPEHEFLADLLTAEIDELTRKALRDVRKQRPARRFQRHLDHLLEQMQNPAETSLQTSHPANQPPVDWRRRTGRWLATHLHEFLLAVPDDQTDQAALHQFRITTKHLRYAAETVHRLVPAVQLKPAIKILTRFQDLLGDLHDASVRLDRFQTMPHARKRLRPLARTSQSELQAHTRQWQTAWQTNTVLTLLKQFSKALAHLLTPPPIHDTTNYE